MKALKPSMKENKRYLLVKGVGPKENVEKAILEFCGILGYSKASPNLIKSSKDYAIFSVNREALNEVRAAICVWPKKMFVERVSGTLKGLGKR